MIQTQGSGSYVEMKMEGIMNLESAILENYWKERKELNEKEIYYQNNKQGIREKIAEAVTSVYKYLFNPKKVEGEALVDLISKEKRKEIILEEGAGNDTLYKDIIDKIRPNKYYRSDVSEKQLNQVQDSTIDNIVYNGIKHQIADNAIDVAFSKCVLHHIDNGCALGREKNRIDYLLEQKRIIKEGGKVITVDVDNPTKGSFKSKFWHYLKHRLILGEEEHYFLEEKEAVGLYNKAGFKNIINQKIETYKGTYFIVSGEK